MKINSHLKSGDKIGNYYIIRPLGTGGAGTVYLAEGMYGSVAIKVFHHWTPELEQEFLREGQTASKINHPNVVSCLDAQVDPETKRCYLVMEYVDAGTAMSLLNRGEKLDWEWACYIALSAAQALEAAAQYKIVHRDIKPENIMLLSSGIVKLADLGIAWHAGDRNTGRIQGTPAYIAPEQIQKNAVIDCRCDIYSLGATLYHLLTGELPFPAENLHDALDKVLHAPPPDPRKVKPEIPKPVAELVMKMMAKNPASRPQSAAKLVSILSRILRMNVPPKSFSKAMDNTSVSIFLNNIQQYFFRDAHFFKLSFALLITSVVLGLLPPFLWDINYTAKEREELKTSYEQFVKKQMEQYLKREAFYKKRLNTYFRQNQMNNSQLLLKKIVVDCDLNSVRLLLKNAIPMPDSKKAMTLFAHHRPAAAIPREQAEQMADLIDNHAVVFPEGLWKALCRKIMRSDKKISMEYYHILENLLYSDSFRKTVKDADAVMQKVKKRNWGEEKQETLQQLEYLLQSHNLLPAKKPSAVNSTPSDLQ